MSGDTTVLVILGGVAGLIGAIMGAMIALGFRPPAAIQSALETRVAAVERGLGQLATHEYAITTLTKAVERLDGICEKLGDRIETLLSRMPNNGTSHRGQ